MLEKIKDKLGDRKHALLFPKTLKVEKSKCLFCFVFAKHKMQLRVYEGREFPLKGATNASQSISKEILLILLSRRKNSFVYIILQLGANILNISTVIATVNVHRAFCARDCLACFICLIPSSRHTYEVGTISIPHLTNEETEVSPWHTVKPWEPVVLYQERYSPFSSLKRHSLV